MTAYTAEPWGDLYVAMAGAAAALYRFGSYAPIPVVHGMTVGELARLYVGERMLRASGPHA